MSTETHFVPAELDDLTAIWSRLEAQRVEIVQAQNEIKNRLREQLDLGKYVAADHIITVTPPIRRFNRQRALEVLPPELIPAISVSLIDTTLARKTLPPALYEACQLPISEDNQVSIR